MSWIWIFQLYLYQNLSTATKSRIPLAIQKNYMPNRYPSYNYQSHANDYRFLDNRGSLNKTTTIEEDLVRDLKSRGDLNVRPNACKVDCNEPVIVNVSYNVAQILGLFWNDFRVEWDPKEYGNIQRISLSANELWQPDVGIMNGKNSDDFDFSVKSRGRLKMNNTGRIEWMHGAILNIACPLDVSFFPFDYQTCYIILSPWQSQVDQLVLNPFMSGPVVDNSFMPNSNISEWEIQSTQFKSRQYTDYSGEQKYMYLEIAIHLKRQPLYFVVLVLVPFSMLSVLACLIFTLDDTGDRLSVALSLVLSMTMYVVIVSSNAPRSMRTIPVMGIFLLDQLGLLSIATVLAVINNKLHQSTGLHSIHDFLYAMSGSAGLTAIPPITNPRLKASTRRCNSPTRAKHELEHLTPHGYAHSNHHFQDFQCRSSCSSEECSEMELNDLPQYSSDVTGNVEDDFSNDDSTEFRPKTNKLVNHSLNNQVKISSKLTNLDAKTMHCQLCLESYERDLLHSKSRRSNSNKSRQTSPRITINSRRNRVPSAKPKPQASQHQIQRHIKTARKYSTGQSKYYLNSSPPPPTLSSSKVSNLFMTTQSEGRSRSRNSLNRTVIPNSTLEEPKRISLASSIDDVIYPYRRLASQLDCIEMVLYLLLSSLNAIVCLILLPNLAQNKHMPVRDQDKPPTT